MRFECGYCKKTFAKETSIAVHMCEPKRRYMNKDDRGVQLGLQAYVKFYEQAQKSVKPKTYDDFCVSSYYKAFVKFGKYCVDVKVINPVQYMIWLLKHNKKIDNWASDRIYTEYLVDYVKLESLDDAMRRTVEHSISWEETTGHPAKDMLRYGNVNALCYDITTGRISPWVLYSCESGRKFLSSLSSEQVAMTWAYIDSDKWQQKFADYPTDKTFVEEVLKVAGW
jgi:hypothetical protein